MQSSAREPKRIALFITSLRAGGGEKAMVELAQAFADRGHQVDLVVMKAEGALGNHIASNVRLVDLKVGRIYTAKSKLVAYLNEADPQAIMAVDEYSHLTALAAVKKTGKNIRVVLRVGNMYSELFKRYKTFRDKYLIPFLMKRMYKRADAIVANSHGVAQDIQAITGIEPTKVSVIYNPKNLEKIAGLMKEDTQHEWFENKTLPLIVACGRLREQKNFPLLLRAFATLQKEIPSRLVIVGAGREEKRLRSLIQELGIDSVVSLLGYSENPYKYMAKADIFAFPSLWEGMPNALIEALICGLPAVAADCDSGPREVLAPDTDYKKRLSPEAELEEARYGILVPVNNEKMLTAALRKLLVDRELRARYAQAALMRGQDFDMKKGIIEYEKVLALI